MFAALGRFTYRSRKAIVVFWALLAVLGGVLAPFAGTALKGGGFDLPRLESYVARDVLIEELGAPASALQVLFMSDDWLVTDPRFQADLDRAIQRLQAVPEVESVISVRQTGNPRLISEDGRKTYLTVALRATDDSAAQQVVPKIQQAARGGQLTAMVTGLPAIYADIDYVSYRDLQRAEVVTFPLALLALLLVFGSVVAAGVPVAIGAVTVAVTLGILFLVAQVFDMSIFVLNVATLLGLGVGIDYSLLMVGRFREELRATAPTFGMEQAVVNTVSTAGKAVFFSGLTVAIGLTGLFTFEFMMLRSIGLGGMLVVVMAVLASLTLTPALLGIAGQRINALAVRLPFTRPAGQAPPEHGFWTRTSSWVMRRPIPVLLVTTVFLVLLASPFLRVRLGAPDARILPTDIESRAAFDILQNDFAPGEVTPLVIALRTSDGARVFDADRIAGLYRFVQTIQQDPAVSRVDSLVSIDPRITLAQYQALFARPELLPQNGIAQGVAQLASEDVTAIQVITPFLTTSREAQALIDRLRAQPPPPGWQAPLVTGPSAGIKDIVDELYREVPRAIAFIVVATSLALLVLFRSVVVPLKAIVMNTLSIGASFGALVFIFQDGNFSEILRFEPLGYVDAFIPVILFCVLFGLSMDYEVFLLSRIREGYVETGDNARSVREGLQRTGGVITSAAFILVVVAGSFAFTDIILIKAIGIGVAISIGLDASVVRTLVVPSTMRLLGRWNWWAPAPLQRVLARLPLEH